jgi:polar amino acid transport system substrate-binding protein
MIMQTHYKAGLLLIAVGAACWWYFAPQPAQQNSDVLYVGTNAEFQPFTFIQKDGTLVGFDIDIARAVCDRLGKECVIKNMSFDALIPEIQLGSVHMLAAGMTPTPERAKRVLFTTPHLDGSSLMLVMRKDGDLGDDVATILKTKRIAVNQGYTADSYVTNYGCPHIVHLSGASVSEGLLALASNQADCYVTADNVIKPFFDQDTKHEYSSVVLPDTNDSCALAVSQKFPELHAQVQQVLAQMQADGTLDQIKTKWGLS